MRIDRAGSPVAVVRMEPKEAYTGVSELLRTFINNSDTAAWAKIRAKIDYIYSALDYALKPLDKETGFRKKVLSELGRGKKLLFKPNLVSPTNIDPVSHGEASGNTACTEWPLIAALMRWFHDKLDLSYHQMSLGEAATALSTTAGFFNLAYRPSREVTTEAVIEGRSEDFFGGWGFYFVRTYLADTHPQEHRDSPMNGYEESVSGMYMPPGRAGDRLMVYDLNRMYDVKGKERSVAVPGGANFTEISLPKVIVGGEPGDSKDLKNYPGCVLINVPRLKVHGLDLLTNAIKNLGIGLYPMESADDSSPEKPKWKYAFPFKSPPGLKAEIPHSVWVPEMDDETGLPIRNDRGEYITKKTGGMAATQVDVVKAALSQGVFMLHVTDGIQAININHTGASNAVKVSEGLVAASLDPVALDTFCAHYCFKNVPMSEAKEIQKKHRLPTDFLQRVPIPVLRDKEIVSEQGYDSPFLRYNLYRYAESRGLGVQRYHVIGQEVTRQKPLASTRGHFGLIDDTGFQELMTGEFYYDATNFLWGLQRTALAYLEANDKLTGSNYLKHIQDAFDENQDHVIDYDEWGTKGFLGPYLRMAGNASYLRAVEPYGFLRGPFLSASTIRYTNPEWNSDGHDFLMEFQTAQTITTAFLLSRARAEQPDPLFPKTNYGAGKWPTMQYASLYSLITRLYGPSFPRSISVASLYGLALQYADKRYNKARYTGDQGISSNPEAISDYLKEVEAGAKRLGFTLYVPKGFGTRAGKKIPNVRETGDRVKLFTAHFPGKETW